MSIQTPCAQARIDAQVELLWYGRPENTTPRKFPSLRARRSALKRQGTSPVGTTDAETPCQKRSRTSVVPVAQASPSGARRAVSPQADIKGDG
eukprot:5054993-Pleurochrysis_carterae.AAC.1